ncbi:MAG: DUF86 domain-containing protein [Patescibacteria group bacterium]
MLDKTFLQRKLDSLSTYVDKLERLATRTDIAAIKKGDVTLDAIERNFQLAVDQMVDINTHIIKSGNFGTVDDLQSTFVMLGDFEVLEKSFAKRIAPIVGVRNMLVHRYEKLDTDIFLTNLVNNFSDFKTYLIQINEYLRKIG